MANPDIDLDILKELQQHAQQLRTQHAARDDMFTRYEEMYLLNWSQKANRKLKHMQVTASPNFRNEVQGAVRLMVATDPQINVEPTEKTKGVSIEKVEQFLNDTLYQSGRLAGEPVHYQLITAGILYDEMHAAITSTADMLEYVKQGKPDTERGKLYQKAAVRRWEEIAETTNFLIEPWNPNAGYPEFGTTGLTAYYRVILTTVGEIFDRFGQTPEVLQHTPRNAPVYLHTFFDPVYTAVWVDGQGGGILLKPHGLPRIPVVAQILNGSRLFGNKEDQRQPFGYTLLKSGLWNAQNLTLTAMFTAVLNQAWTPTKVYTPAVDGAQIEMNHDEDVIQLHPGDKLEPMLQKGLIDPAMQEVYTLANDLGEQSTIYSQAIGAPFGTRQAYSAIALMQQAGRLPLVGPQRRGGWGISSICETMLAMMREEPRYRANTDLQVSDMPRGIEVQTKLEVSLPQDKLQQANILSILTNPQDPKVSTAWALENILNINDPEQMRRDIWNERTTEQMYQMTVAKLLMAQQQQAQPGMGGPGGPMSGAPFGVPGQPGGGPQQSALDYARGGSQPAAAAPGQGGVTTEGGLPQAQTGLIPGAGEGVAPSIPPNFRQQPGGR